MYLTPLILCIALADSKLEYAKPSLLVEPAELKKEAVGRFHILDVRSKKAYQSGHIPGAVWIDLAAWSRLVTADTKPEVWLERLGKAGIDGKKPVVIYDDEKNRDAARMWWILRYRGVSDARLIQGGYAAYLTSGGTTTKDETTVRTTKPDFKPSPDRMITREQILGGIKSGNLEQLIDARTTAEHCGESGMAKRRGAIPGARHLDWTDTLDAKTGRFKPAPEMAKLFKDAGISLDKPATTYCQSGGRAAVMAFVYELMTAKPARNYYRSWAEWGNSADTPIVTPKKPKE